MTLRKHEEKKMTKMRAIEAAVHIAFGVVGDKIVYEAGFWDNLPMYLAQQALETEEE